MHGNRYITIPNMLSASRIVFLPLLFGFAHLDMKLSFTIGYAILGSTDMFDGIMARKLNQKTDIGRSLDSFADLVFYLSTAYFVYLLYPQYMKPNMGLLYVFLVVLAASFLVSWYFCGKPVLMHTVLLKLCAVLVYSIMICSFFFDTSSLIAATLWIYFLAFAEEMVIFIKYGDVDPDIPGLPTLIRRERAQSEVSRRSQEPYS